MSPKRQKQKTDKETPQQPSVSARPARGRTDGMLARPGWLPGAKDSSSLPWDFSGTTSKI